MFFELLLLLATPPILAFASKIGNLRNAEAPLHKYGYSQRLFIVANSPSAQVCYVEQTVHRVSPQTQPTL